jgi:aminomethyltransferase
LLLIDVDFHSSRKAIIESQKYSPFELGLGRLVDLTKGPFVGRAALTAEYRRGPRRQIVGLEVDWSEVEALYEAVGLPPTAPATA